jgi:rhamnose utilization protein RhaD (predicted bifunctional aldolase and dehydrogenase)/NAD(P)-dependent dehydrogenase (short-subunit alcohol dehydrogenase family)
MADLWNDEVAPPASDPLAECVYGSRLIGADPNMVLHGGGNSSVKAPFPDITGAEIETLWVKGSGWDMASIEKGGFAPLPLDRLRQLLDLETLSDIDMMRELSAARLDPAAPQPSVESLLHALIPYRAVLHSHADAIVTLTNLADGAQRVREVLGEDVMIVPYVMPGFDLAIEIRDRWSDGGEGSTGMVLMNHGLFTYGDSTRQAFELHTDLIARAARWLDVNAPHRTPETGPLPPADPLELARLRSEISRTAGRPMISVRHASPEVARFVHREDLASLANRGPLTPDHIIRTKRTPMVGRDVNGYAEEYRNYYERNLDRARGETTMLDPAPRVVLDPEIGMLTLGANAAAAGIAADIFCHTIPTLTRAEDHLGGYVALPEGDLFEVEYWELEQAKLKRQGASPELTGMVALVTGAASGIGRACAGELMSRGAAVTGLDLSPSVTETFDSAAWLGIECDVTDPAAQAAAIAQSVERFGGVDIAVVCAGVFGRAGPISELDRADWRRTMAVNTDAAADLFSQIHPYLRLSPAGGRVLVVSTRNVPAPGPGAAAYSASKAALTQLARVAALEWASDGIRVNIVNPDAVFDTGLWNDELLATRAAQYDMDVESYKRRNLLRQEVTSQQVASAVAELVSDRFGATTGAQIPIDGGNERVI